MKEGSSCAIRYWIMPVRAESTTQVVEGVVDSKREKKKKKKWIFFFLFSAPASHFFFILLSQFPKDFTDFLPCFFVFFLLLKVSWQSRFLKFWNFHVFGMNIFINPAISFGKDNLYYILLLYFCEFIIISDTSLSKTKLYSIVFKVPPTPSKSAQIRSNYIRIFSIFLLLLFCRLVRISLRNRIYYIDEGYCTFISQNRLTKKKEQRIFISSNITVETNVNSYFGVFTYFHCNWSKFSQHLLHLPGFMNFQKFWHSQKQLHFQ